MITSRNQYTVNTSRLFQGFLFFFLREKRKTGIIDEQEDAQTNYYETGNIFASRYVATYAV